MPFTTNAELRTSIKSWSKRSDFTDALCDDFIRLCEVDFNRRLRIRQMENVDSLFTVSSELTSLPTGFLELRSIKNLSAPSYPLKLGTPQSIDEYYDAADSGMPVQYVIEGTNLRVGPSPDGSYTFRLDYYKSFDGLSDSNPSNFILANFPDVYLWGSLAQTAPYIGNDERLPLWEGKYEKALLQVKEADQRSKRAGSQSFMRIRVNP